MPREFQFQVSPEVAANESLLAQHVAKLFQVSPKEIQKVEWVPAGQPLLFQRTETELAVSLPENNADTYACVLKIL